MTSTVGAMIGCLRDNGLSHLSCAMLSAGLTSLDKLKACSYAALLSVIQDEMTTTRL